MPELQTWQHLGSLVASDIEARGGKGCAASLINWRRAAASRTALGYRSFASRYGLQPSMRISERSSARMSPASSVASSPRAWPCHTGTGAGLARRCTRFL